MPGDKGGGLLALGTVLAPVDNTAGNNWSCLDVENDLLVGNTALGGCSDGGLGPGGGDLGPCAYGGRERVACKVG